MFPMSAKHRPMLESAPRGAPFAPGGEPRHRVLSRTGAVARVAMISVVVIVVTLLGIVPAEAEATRRWSAPSPGLVVTGGVTWYFQDPDDDRRFVEVTGAQLWIAESGNGILPVLVVFERKKVEWFVDGVKLGWATSDPELSFADLRKATQHDGRETTEVDVSVTITYAVSYRSVLGQRGSLADLSRATRMTVTLTPAA